MMRFNDNEEDGEKLSWSSLISLGHVLPSYQCKPPSVNPPLGHLSVLKAMFPNGVNVLSLFTGIGGGEVPLHKLGIH